MSKLSENPLENLTGPAATAMTARLAEFSLKQRRTLLAIAHEAILSTLERRPFAETPPAALELMPALMEPRGVFTTLYRVAGRGGELSQELRRELHYEVHRELRGCVGYVEPIAPLYRAVEKTARAAAFEDSRFSPVTRVEAGELEVCLSVLSHLFPIHPEVLEIGYHGLVISQGARRGLLLPQVPVEHGWDRESFLEQTCRKAGLPLDSWRRGATIEAFTAEVFSDADVEGAC